MLSAVLLSGCLGVPVEPEPVAFTYAVKPPAVVPEQPKMEPVPECMVEVAGDDRVTIILYTAPSCGPCEMAKRDITAWAAKRKVRLVPFPGIDPSDAYPQLYWQAKGRVWFFKGWQAGAISDFEVRFERTFR